MEAAKEGPGLKTPFSFKLRHLAHLKKIKTEAADLFLSLSQLKAISRETEPFLLWPRSGASGLTAGAFGSGLTLYFFLCSCLSCTTSLIVFLLGSIKPMLLRSTLKESAVDSPSRISPRIQLHMFAPAIPRTNRAMPPSFSFQVLPLLYSPSWRRMVVKGWSILVQRIWMIDGLTHTATQRQQHITTAAALSSTSWATPPLVMIGVLQLLCIFVRTRSIADGLSKQGVGPSEHNEHWTTCLCSIGNNCSLSFGFVHFTVGFISAAWLCLLVTKLFCSCVLVIGLFSYCLGFYFLQLINGLGLLGNLILVERWVRRSCSYIFSVLSYTIDGIMAPFVVLADFGLALGGILFLSRYHQEPIIADMIHLSMTHCTHDFTATHHHSEYFHEGLLGHLFKVLVTSPMEYGRESAGLSTTIHLYFGYLSSLLQITYEWPSILCGIYFLIGGAYVVASGGLDLPSHFYHICILRFLLAASALLLDFGFLPKDAWYCVVLISRVDFLSLSSLVEPSWKLIFLLYQCCFSVWACPSVLYSVSI